MILHFGDGYNLGVLTQGPPKSLQAFLDDTP